MAHGVYFPDFLLEIVLLGEGSDSFEEVDDEMLIASALDFIAFQCLACALLPLARLPPHVGPYPPGAGVDWARELPASP